MDYKLWGGGLENYDILEVALEGFPLSYQGG